MASDPIVAASGIVMALQTIVARNVDPLDPAVITVGSFQSGALATIIPGDARLNIGVRTCTKGTRELIRKRIETLVALQAKAFGCEAEILYNPGISYPPGYNTPEHAKLVRDVAIELGQDPARVDMRGPFMFSEDFAFMQEVVPSCYFGLGNGKSRSLHDSGYDFNDELLVKGPVFWGRLVERFLKAA
jgi:hippurate hydrolase